MLSDLSYIVTAKVEEFWNVELVKFFGADQASELFDLGGKLSSLSPIGDVVFLYLILGVDKYLNVFISLLKLQNAKD